MKLGTTELLIILAIILVLFGPSQIPKLTKMFKKTGKSFKEGMNEEDEQAQVTSGGAVHSGQNTQNYQEVPGGQNNPGYQNAQNFQNNQGYQEVPGAQNNQNYQNGQNTNGQV